MSRICFVSLNAAGALQQDQCSHVGGVERQTELMARWLTERGHDVSVIVWSSQNETEDCVSGGITILRICAQKQGIRGIRFFTPHWTSLIGALGRANADVYFHNAAEATTGQIALWCMLHRRRFVYSVASEPACERGLPTLPTFLERGLHRIGLRAATEIIVQNRTQQMMLLENFGLKSIFLPMPCEPFDTGRQKDSVNCDRQTVIWVGRIVPLKRLEMLLEVASRLPRFRFEIVGGVNVSSSYAQRVLDKASTAKNVIVTGSVRYEEAWACYRRSAMLVCTSAYEGFPNTFLEAMSLGIPVVSTFDPGRILTNQEVGVAVSGVVDLTEAISESASNRNNYDRLSRNAREYFLRNHHVDVAMPAFESVIIRNRTHEAGAHAKPTKGGEKRNIALVISNLEFGGSQRQLVELAKNLPSEAFNVHVYCLSNYIPLARALETSSICYHVVEKRSKYDITVAFRLARLFREHNISLAHAFLFDAEIATRLACKLSQVSIMIGSERNSDYLVKRNQQIAYAFTKRFRDLCIANSHSGAKFNSITLGYPASHYRVIHNCVDTSRFRPRDKHECRRAIGMDKNVFVIGMFASFKPQKNHEMLFKAIDRNSDLRCNVKILFVGDALYQGAQDTTSYFEKVRKLVVDYELQNVCEFVGNQEEVELLYPACDITVLPSHFEGLPNVM